MDTVVAVHVLVCVCVCVYAYSMRALHRLLAPRYLVWPRPDVAGGRDYVYAEN